MSLKESQQAYYLAPYQECLGPLRELVRKEGALIASIGKVSLVLPLEMEPDLKPLLGQKIAILRTDLPQRPYLYRQLTENPVNCILNSK